MSKEAVAAYGEQDVRSALIAWMQFLERAMWGNNQPNTKDCNLLKPVDSNLNNWACRSPQQ